jgi:hypothetical protein
VTIPEQPEQPSRSYATPAEIDAFLRQHFAEDVLLHFYRALGDEVLDEAIAHGREYRTTKESRSAKHVYLAGMADVMDEMWDYRFYPAVLPDMGHHDRPHMRPPEVHPDESSYHPSRTRLPSPKTPGELLCDRRELIHPPHRWLMHRQSVQCPGIRPEDIA